MQCERIYVWSSLAHIVSISKYTKFNVLLTVHHAMKEAYAYE